MTALAANEPLAADFAVERRRWGWPQYLALIGLPFLVWEIWSVIAWAIDNPHQITAYRNAHGATRWIALGTEISMGLTAVWIIMYLVKGCREQRRFLTFDVMFCTMAGTMFWMDTGMNFFQPNWFSNSSYTNVNSVCGHIPGVVNPDCGRMPDPIILNVFFYMFVFMTFVIQWGPLIEKIKRRWPSVSKPQLLLVIVAMAMVFDFILEAVYIMPTHLSGWTPTGLSIPIGFGLDWPVAEWIAMGIFMGFPVALQLLRNDRGETLVERGLERYSSRTRTTIVMFALYGFFQLLIWTASMLPAATGFYAKQWTTEYPSDLVNGMCDAPGITDTRYGTCPGDPGFRLPGRHSLPGESP